MTTKYHRELTKDEYEAAKGRLAFLNTLDYIIDCDELNHLDDIVIYHETLESIKRLCQSWHMNRIAV